MTEKVPPPSTKVIGDEVSYSCTSHLAREWSTPFRAPENDRSTKGCVLAPACRATTYMPSR